MQTEVQCLIKYNKIYHFHYGLSEHFSAVAANNFLPKQIYINQIRLDTGAIYHVSNNIFWYVYNPNTHRIPVYNFIVTPHPWTKYPGVTKRYGFPDKIIACGDNIYLGIYQKPASVERLNKVLYQQALRYPSVVRFLKQRHLSPEHFETRF